LRPEGFIIPSLLEIPSCTRDAVSAKYKSSEVAGKERVIAEADGEKVSEANISVMVPGFLS